MSPRRSWDFGEAERLILIIVISSDVTPPQALSQRQQHIFLPWTSKSLFALAKAGSALELVDKVAYSFYKAKIWIWCSRMRRIPPRSSLMSVRIVMANFLEAIKSKWRLDIIHCAPSQSARRQMRHFNYCARLDGDVCCCRIARANGTQCRFKPTQTLILHFSLPIFIYLTAGKQIKTVVLGISCAAFPAQVLDYLFIWIFVYLRVNNWCCVETRNYSGSHTRTDAERGVLWCLAPASVRSEERQISKSRLEYNDSFYYSNRIEEWHTEG